MSQYFLVTLLILVHLLNIGVFTDCACARFFAVSILFLGAGSFASTLLFRPILFCLPLLSRWFFRSLAPISFRFTVSRFLCVFFFFHFSPRKSFFFLLFCICLMILILDTFFYIAVLLFFELFYYYLSQFSPAFQELPCCEPLTDPCYCLIVFYIPKFSGVWLNLKLKLEN